MVILATALVLSNIKLIPHAAPTYGSVGDVLAGVLGYSFATFIGVTVTQFLS